MLSGWFVCVTHYDGDGVVSEKHYCEKDFRFLATRKFMPPKTKGHSIGINWEHID